MTEGTGKEGIRLSGIWKRLGNTQVLADFSAFFPVGKTSVVMGESGCGKTTLLNLMMGFEKPDRGTVLGVPERKSAVFQEDRLLPAFRPLANLRAAAGRKLPEEALKEELSLLGISGEDLRKPVSAFSGGMKRRLAIVRAVLGEGDVLFLDEPFKGLDAGWKEAAMEYVRRHTRGKTVILVTHDRVEAERMRSGAFVRMEKPV